MPSRNPISQSKQLYCCCTYICNTEISCSDPLPHAWYMNGPYWWQICGRFHFESFDDSTTNGGLSVLSANDTIGNGRQISTYRIENFSWNSKIAFVKFKLCCNVVGLGCRINPAMSCMLTKNKNPNANKLGVGWSTRVKTRLRGWKTILFDFDCGFISHSLQFKLTRDIAIRNLTSNNKAQDFRIKTRTIFDAKFLWQFFDQFFGPPPLTPPPPLPWLNWTIVRK